MTSTEPDRSHPALVLASLSLACVAVATLDSSVVPALPTFQHELHTAETQVTWLLTACLLSAPVVTAIIERLVDLYGRQRVLPAPAELAPSRPR